MHRTFRRLIPIGVAALTVSAALATPLPDPPFSSGGFIPPDSLVFKQETAVGKLLTNYARNRVKCDQKAVIALQLAYEPANMGKLPDVQAAWSACVAKIDLKYTTDRDRLLLKGTPACLDQAGIDAIKAQLDAQFALLGPIVYCDDDAANPDPVTGLDIPDFKQEAEGEVSAAKVVTKAGLLAGKCYTLAVKYAFKFGATLPPEALAKIDACLAKAATYGSEGIDKLDQTQKLPDCLPVASAQGLVTAAIALGGQFTDETYCASPSGAFVDGVDVP